MYVIWTESKNSIDVVDKVASMFGGDNVIHGNGHYNGKGEESLRIEIFNDRKPDFASRVYEFAEWVAEHNDQDSVALLRQDDPELVVPWIERKPSSPDQVARIETTTFPPYYSIVRNEFGIEQLDEPEGVYEKMPVDKTHGANCASRHFGECTCGVADEQAEIEANATPNAALSVSLAQSLERQGFRFSGCLSTNPAMTVFVYQKRDGLGNFLESRRLYIRSNGDHEIGGKQD